MAFWEESDSIEVERITDYFKKLNYSPNTQGYNLADVEDSQFIDVVLLKSWIHFQYLFKFDIDLLNKYTPFNQKHLKEKAKPSLEKLKNERDLFLSLLLRVIYEYYFWNPYSDEIPDIMNSGVLSRLHGLTNNTHSYAQFSWIEHSMATAITKDLINSDEFTSLRKIGNDIENYEKIITDLRNKSTEEYTKTVDDLNEELNESINKINSTKIDLEVYNAKLNEYKAEYNFVLLSKAFKNLHDRKTDELKTAKKLTWRFTKALAIPPSLAFLNHIFNWFPTENGFSSLYFHLPLLTFEILIFYFMRLYYSEVKTLNTQLLQIDHRLSLCEFIHDYIEKKNADKDNKQSWDLFESLIFSPIQVASDNIPSIIDGANAVADLAGKIISKSKD